MRIVFLAVSTWLAISAQSLPSAQAAPTPVMSDEMFSGREKDPVPDWEKKHRRSSSKKKSKTTRGKKNSPTQTTAGANTSTGKQGAPNDQSQ